MMEEYEKQFPLDGQEDDMYDMYYYDQQQQNGYGGGYGYEDGMDDEEEGFDSDEGMNGLYVEGLADRIWDDND